MNKTISFYAELDSNLNKLEKYMKIRFSHFYSKNTRGLVLKNFLNAKDYHFTIGINKIDYRGKITMSFTQKEDGIISMPLSRSYEEYCKTWGQQDLILVSLNIDHKCHVFYLSAPKVLDQIKNLKINDQSSLSFNLSETLPEWILQHDKIFFDKEMVVPTTRSICKSYFEVISLKDKYIDKIIDKNHSKFLKDQVWRSSHLRVLKDQSRPIAVKFEDGTIEQAQSLKIMASWLGLKQSVTLCNLLKEKRKQLKTPKGLIVSAKYIPVDTSSITTIEPKIDSGLTYENEDKSQKTTISSFSYQFVSENDIKVEELISSISNELSSSHKVLQQAG